MQALPADKIVLQSNDGYSQDGLYQFSGRVLMQHENQLLQADGAQFDEKNQRLQANGNVQFQVPGLISRGDGALLQLDEHRGIVNESRYLLEYTGGTGHAKKIEVIGEVAELQGASYTTCPGTQPAWQLAAQSITLDRANNEGIARHVVLQLGQVPVFYVPWASFALQGRKTGFLTPALGYSRIRGADITLPYYLNLAPAQDATLYPRLIENRGPQLGGEYRYLTASSAGQVFSEYLQDDQLYGDNRSLFSFKHRAQPNDHWSYSTQLEQVSDRDYFSDLGSNLSTSSQTQLERNLRTQWRGKNWWASAMLQDYQMLRSHTAPHRRLPQLQYRHQSQHRWLQTELLGEYSYFQHDTLLNGHRLLVEPVLTTGYDSPGAYLQPRLRLRHNRYWLQDQPDDGGTNAVFSLDSGLRFIRHGQRIDQTLEPRLFYTYSPYRDQHLQPIFDTGALDLSFAQLFRDFRYIGGDRIGDENRLSTGLSSSFVRQTDGRQLLRLSLAHARYFADHRTQLPAEEPTLAGDRRIAGEIASEFLPDWSFATTLFQRTTDRHPDKLATRLNYDGDRQGLDLSARYRQNLLKQVGAAGYVELGPHWQLAAKWTYSLQYERSNEAVIGVQYLSCCWRLRTVAQQFIKNAQGETDRSIGVEIELTGLATVGRKTEDRLSREIMGYKSEGF